MKHIKLFEQFISEEESPKPSAKDIFIPRRLKERWDDLLIPYLNKGYTKEQIFVVKPIDETFIINMGNIEKFKNIKVIIGNIEIKRISDLSILNIEEISGDFDCVATDLINLKGVPKIINGNFYCYRSHLTSLVDGPNIVTGDFDCSYNKLTSLEGGPSTVGGSFSCSNNTKKFTEEEVRKVVDVKGKVYV